MADDARNFMQQVDDLYGVGPGTRDLIDPLGDV
jgi:hypothetical protein